ARRGAAAYGSSALRRRTGRQARRSTALGGTQWPCDAPWETIRSETFTQALCPAKDEVQCRVPPASESGLVRVIGVRQLTASIINVTIGAGIFVLPAAAAAGLGPAAPLAYVVCAVLMALIVCCFAAAGSRVSLTGGGYAYV